MTELTSIQKFQYAKEVVDSFLESLFTSDEPSDLFFLSAEISTYDELVVTFSISDPQNVNIVLFDSSNGFARTREESFPDWDIKKDTFKARLFEELRSGIAAASLTLTTVCRLCCTLPETKSHN